MHEPPPLPRFGELEAIVFRGTKTGLFTVRRSTEIVERANRQALDWLNENDGQVKVEHVTSSQDKLVAHVTVWFRKRL